MSLLTQFYPGPGGDSTTVVNPWPAGMGIGGVTGGASTSISPSPSSGTLIPTYNTPANASGFITVGSVLPFSQYVSLNSATTQPFPYLQNRVTTAGMTATFSNTVYTNWAVFVNHSLQAGGTLTFNTKGVAGLNISDFPALPISIGGSVTSLALCRIVVSFTSSTINCSNLTTITNCSVDVNGTGSLDFSSCSLTSDSVDAVLVSVQENRSAGASTLNLGGTNAPPGAAGSAAKTALIASGMTVITN